VKEGNLDFYNKDCVKHSYSAGQSFTEAAEPHNGVNPGPGMCAYLMTLVKWLMIISERHQRDGERRRRGCRWRRTRAKPRCAGWRSAGRSAAQTLASSPLLTLPHTCSIGSAPARTGQAFDRQPGALAAHVGLHAWLLWAPSPSQRSSTRRPRKWRLSCRRKAISATSV